MFAQVLGVAHAIPQGGGHHRHRFAPRDGTGERHFHVDLNETSAADTPPPSPTTTSSSSPRSSSTSTPPPPTLLAYLRRFLAPDGRLILQTPNAVALPRRVRMLAGRNPTEPIRPDRFDPGHFHEYTVAELTEAATAAGWRVQSTNLANYFANCGRPRAAYNRLVGRLPRSLRGGITLVLTAT